MAAGDVWRLSAIGDFDATHLVVTTLHVKFLTPAANFNDAAQWFKSYILTNYAGYLANTFVWRQVNGITVNVTPPQSGTYVGPLWPYTGLVAGDSCPYTNAVVVKHSTAYAGRSYRGRSYLPAPAETYQASSALTAPALTAIQGHFDTLVTAWGAGGTDPNYRWVVWSSKPGIGATEVTGATVRSVLGTQRRRRPGVGA